MDQLEAALGRLPVGAVFCGLTAAWLHGFDVPWSGLIEANVPLQSQVTTRAGMKIRRYVLTDKDATRVRGVPCTTLLRTVADICSTLPTVEAVVVADAALHTGRLSIEQLALCTGSRAGRRGVRNLRRVIEHAEPAAESPMESRLRMALVLGGLPRPKAQVPIHDASGHFVGRPDLYYEEQRLGIEYDGAFHRDALASDNRRQNNLFRAGVSLLRFTSGDLRNPRLVAAQVREMLTDAPRVHTRRPQRRHDAPRVHTRAS